MTRFSLPRVLPRAAWLVSLALAAAVIAPGAAFAQSAGDEQYADPLAGQDQGSGNSGSDNSGSGSQGGSEGGGSGGGEGTGTPVAQADTPQPSTSASAAADGNAEALPRTGLDVAPLLIMGAALLTAGLLVQLAVGPARRRRRGEPVVLFDGTLPPLR